MKQLHHNGVLVPPMYKGLGLTIDVRGETIYLTDEQEEMATAWAKKIGTPYVDDPKFAENFHNDFSKVLGIEVNSGDVGYSAIHKAVLEERERRVSLTREERKAQVAQRKASREENKEKYGWAMVDGVRMEIGNYTVEPSSIFMGRGKHPRRGSWKEGPRHGDIELNLSPDTPRPPGEWKAVVWEPDTMWIARWRDRLSGKMKYVWPSDSSPLKQEKDVEKFDKARDLRDNLRRVRRHILENLGHEDPRRRKTATVTFLIYRCKFRVGDEKDEDEEAETIGASTLKPEHITFNGDGTVTFDFLGKDSVRHLLRTEMPEQIIVNLREFSANPDAPLFEGVDSKRVSDFLDEVMTGLSAKVFRTHYASTAVETSLKKTEVRRDEPEYIKKYAATMANLDAARVCNHKRTIPKTWESSLQRNRDRLKAQQAKAKEKETKLRLRIEEIEKKHSEMLDKYGQALREHETKLKEYEQQLDESADSGKSKALEKGIASEKKAIDIQRQRVSKLKTSHDQRMKTLNGQLENGVKRDTEAIERLRLQIKAQEETKDYNLGTSLKSYIDPRIYLDWGKRVDFDWRKYYPKTLQSKFSWIEAD